MIRLFHDTRYVAHPLCRFVGLMLLDAACHRYHAGYHVASFALPYALSLRLLRRYAMIRRRLRMIFRYAMMITLRMAATAR